MLKICKKCIQLDTRPGIYFDKNGICGACLWNEEKKRIDWEKRRNELKEISDWAKTNSKGNFDCIIGVSGGKDSTKQAITARDELGLRCLLVNSEPEGITEIGKQNIENLKQNGFDVLSLRANPHIMKRIIKYDFYKYLNPVKSSEFPLWASSYIIAEKFGIPLIIQGENAGLTLGTSLTGLGVDSNALNADKANTLSTGWEEYLEIDGITKNDLFLFHYEKKELEKKGIKAIWLQYFLEEWSQRNNAEFSKRYGFKEIPEEEFFPEKIGNYVRFSQLDSDLVPVNQLLKSIKMGFGKCLDFACYDLREGTITKKEAIELVLKYDGKCDITYIEKFCKYIDITINEFWEVAEKFRGPMWKKINGEWNNKFIEILKKELNDSHSVN